MIESGGFIKLHRSLIDWEWFNDPNTFRLFVYCLLKANYTDAKWRGILVDRGTFITSLRNLSYGTGLSLQQVRTSIDKLATTGEITHKAHSKYSVIVINNYNQYQDSNTKDNKQVTVNKHDINKEVTTDKKNNNIRNKEVKKVYNDHVQLTQIEYDNLILEFGDNLIKEYLFRLNEYIAIKGIKYKNHNLVIRKWIRENPKPNWLVELKEEQAVSDNKIYKTKRTLEELKRNFEDL